MKKIITTISFLVCLVFVTIVSASCMSPLSSLKTDAVNQTNEINKKYTNISQQYCDFMSLAKEKENSFDTISFDASLVCTINGQQFILLSDFTNLTNNQIDSDGYFKYESFSAYAQDYIYSIDSKDYVELYALCVALGFSCEQVGESIYINREYSNKRLIVESNSVNINNTYGAMQCDLANFTALQYNTELDAKNAYESLSQNYSVFVDEKIQSQECEYYNKADERYENNVNDATLLAKSFYTWGGNVMGFSEYTDYLYRKCNTLKENIVVVVDSGINYDHEWFRGRISPYCISFTEGTTPYMYKDDNGHGSHIAGTICDLTPSNVKILAIKTLSADGTGYASSVVLAYIYILELLNSGLNVSAINLSYGCPKMWIMQKLYDVMNDKLCQIKEKGTLVCASAGNDSIDVENQVPACFDSVITVTAMNRFKHFESYSNYGSNVDFIAPGTDITSASNTTSWGVQCLSGTSMANPHVAAAVAMLASDSKANYTAQQIETILKTRCAVDLGVEGKDDYYGYGYINLKRLIEEDASTDNAETFHVYFGVDYESYDQDIYSATSIHVGYSLDGTSKSFDITKEADKTINTSNGFNCIIKLGNGYEFIGWYVGSNSNGSNSLLGYNNASCYSTDDNIIITPDMEKNLYIIAKVKKRVLDVQIVINFQNVDEIDGYMGYGCNFIFRSAKVNCIDENKRNVMFDNPQTGVYSSTPRVMTYKFNNIPVGSTYYLRLYLDLDEAKISSVYADGVKKYVSKVTPLPYDDDNREEEQSYQSGLNESNFTTYEVMGSVNISSHLVESYVIAINILV